MSQLDLQEDGVSLDTRAISFNTEMNFAVANRNTRFGISVYDNEFGKAYAITGVHGAPEYGTQECGTRCADDDSRWCGCANDSDENPIFKANSACEIDAPRIAVYAVPSVAQRSLGIAILYYVVLAAIVVEVVVLIVYWVTRPPLKRRKFTEQDQRRAIRHITQVQRSYSLQSGSTCQESAESAESRSQGQGTPSRGIDAVETLCV
jgi:hypothetical protein